ncbi:TerC family protein [Bacillaceae bacterium W0354]
MNWDIFKAVLIIIGLDLILGGDNAVVIAMASRNLPQKGQNKAIVIGTTLAIIVRVCLAAVAIYLLTIPYVQLIGGLFLLYIALKLLTDGNDDPNIESSTTLIGAVKTIVIADVVMGFDNVLAIAAVSDENIYLIITGLMISVPIIIFGSKIILRLMNRYPLIVYAGAALLAYTSADLILKEERIETYLLLIPYEKIILPLLFIVIVCSLGYSINKNASYKNS